MVFKTKVILIDNKVIETQADHAICMVNPHSHQAKQLENN
jgi:hypothetical protein